MREILFRGKAINRDKGYHRTNYKNGDWVYGLITRLYDERFENLPAEMTDKGVSGIEVDYKTIGQYTGLTDKNGKKIFEGDIINIEYPDTIVRNAFVDYIGASFRGDNGLDLWELDGYISLEVIGNIHDNPELLEVTNNENHS